MVDPTLVAGAVGVVAIAAAGIYAYRSGDDASAGADLDNDGEDEISVDFEGNDEEEESTFGIEEAGGTSFDDDPEGREAVHPPEDPTPEAVTEKDGLEDVKGVGETRAEDLADAGFPRPTDLYYASDENLLDISGIGELTVSQIREDIGSVDEGNSEGESDETGESDAEADTN